MAQFITRAEALADPLAARRKVMTKLRALADLEDAESLVVPSSNRRSFDGGVIPKRSPRGYVSSRAHENRRRTPQGADDCRGAEPTKPI